MLCISLTFKTLIPIKRVKLVKLVKLHHLIDLLKTSLTLVCLCNMIPFISPLFANITIYSAWIVPIKSPKLLLQRCGYTRGVARIFSEVHNSPIRFTPTPHSPSFYVVIMWFIFSRSWETRWRGLHFLLLSVLKA